MFIPIDLASDVPIYEQVARQVKFAVAAQAVRPGELVPSVREMARQLAINPNTVARAYRELQGAGILETVRGTGLAVTAPALEMCRRERLALIRDRLRRTLAEAKHSLIDGKELRALIDEELRALEQREQ